jgi:hypothetical protein
MQHAKLLRDFERAVVRQHDTTGTHADVARLGTEPRDQDLGRRACERLRAVVLGDPVASKAAPVRKARKLDGVGKRLRRRRAGSDGRLIDDGKSQPLTLA